MSKTFKDIKHIFFDLDDTLWDLKKNSREGMILTLRELELQHAITDLDHFLNLYMHYNNLAWEAYHQQHLSMEELRIKRFKWTLEHCGIFQDGLAEKMSETYMRITPNGKYLIEGTEVLLSALSESYSLHVLTNGFPDVQPIKLKSSGIYDYFDHIFISDEIGFRKPQKEIFKYCERKIGTKSEHCLMIGDRFETDIKGATHAGWKAVWLNPSGIKRYTYPYVIKKLEELLLLL
ncbi:MAG: YjjG family noncanonical pyrimidine nucleotidase [Bacteroidia bacterium]|nr:YjjG family noncanonical pyrimidine nucleotidase [Bacteroidia bacterium]